VSRSGEERTVPTILLETLISAPAGRCFDLARSVDLHMGSMAHTQERAIDGVTSGLMGPGDTVTWEARHFGLRWRLTSHITDFDAPHSFADQQVRGPFAGFRHVHTFTPQPDGGTLMTDEFVYRAPLGPLGVLADRLFLAQYMRRLLTERNTYLKHVAEEQPALSKSP
jgi:ligand-binding SRPBCC domain-containing protein